jgi:DNA-binding FadR family transcriptional regulator
MMRSARSLVQAPRSAAIPNGSLNMEVERTTLARLIDANEPVGSVRLAEALVEAGFEVAEATAGRILRRLDRAGLTLPLTTKGRVITPKGRQRLAELRVAKEHDTHQVRLVDAVRTRDVDEVMDLLHVRRLVEVEAARLAALRATDQDIAQLTAVDSTQLRDFSKDEPSRVEAARHFHRLVAQVSRNRVLIALAMILLDEANDPLARMLDRLAISSDRRAVPRFAQHHQAVIGAIRRRDPEAAERAMRTHFDQLVAAVRHHGSYLAATDAAGDVRTTRGFRRRRRSGSADLLAATRGSRKAREGRHRV